MSWHVYGAGTTTEELHRNLNDTFGQSYPEPTLGVTEQFEKLRDTVEDLITEGIAGKGPYKCRIAGHVQQTDQDSFGWEAQINLSGEKEVVD